MSTFLRCALWLTLGGWIGSWALFAFVVAPLAFRVLPGPEIAGNLIGPLLTDLHLLGAIAGTLCAVLAWGLRRGRTLVALPLLLAAACLVSHFGVSAAIDAVRPQAFGADAQAEAAARFSQLHTLSRTIFAGVGLGGIATICLHSRADARAAKRI